ncbi:MAG: hypothetical protein WCJ04_11115 [Actinomycetes bacterium]
MASSGFSGATPFPDGAGSGVSGSMSSMQPLAPPIPYLVGAGIALLVSALLLAGGTFNDLAHVAGWIFASVISIGALAAFTAEDLKRRQRSNYSPQPVTGRIRFAMAIIAVLLCGAHAWTLAWSLAAR